MASKFKQIINRTTLSSLKSSIKPSSSSPSPKPFSSLPKPTSSPVPRFAISRVRSELGAVQSLLPLHSAVATERMTSCLSVKSRSCRALSQGTLCRTSPTL